MIKRFGCDQRINHDEPTASNIAFGERWISVLQIALTMRTTEVTNLADFPAHSTRFLWLARCDVSVRVMMQRVTRRAECFDICLVIVGPV